MRMGETRQTRRYRIWLLLAGLVVGLSPSLVEAQPVSLTQITNTTGGANPGPSINAAGTRIAFPSSNNLTGSNADGNQEIFLFDTTTSTFTQITTTTGGGNTGPSINAAGTRIAFSSDRDLTPGSPGNADGNSEIFLFDTTSSTFTQITNTLGAGPNLNPSINAAGTRIAFESDLNVTGSNADGNREIFLFDTTTSTFTTITISTGGFNAFPSINAAGTRIAFHSNRDLTPFSPGNADGNSEIFLRDTTSSTYTQITNTTGGFNLFSSINAAGTRIAFASDRDLTGSNADGNFEIFLFDTTTSTFTQITNTTGGSGSGSPSINAAGTRIAFASDRDLTPGSPGNADGNSEIFLFDTTTSTFTQITSTTGVSGSGSPSINAAGTRIAFSSDRDLTPGSPGNADGNEEIFLAASAEAAAIPTLSEWAQIAMALILMAVAVWSLRRRRPTLGTA